MRKTVRERERKIKKKKKKQRTIEKLEVEYDIIVDYVIIDARRKSRKVYRKKKTKVKHNGN